MDFYHAKVKSVISGDSIILKNQNGQERTLSLAYVSTPHLRKEGDEPFAFESRDFLRKALVGQPVKFKVLYTIPNSKREYGLVLTKDGQKFPEASVEAGWAKLRDDAGKKDESEDVERQVDHLRLLEAQARTDDRGLWASSGGRTNVDHDLGDADAFLSQYKGQPIDALVERVLSGDRMLLRLIMPNKHIQVMTLVAGIRAPTTERVNPSSGETQPAEEFGNESQQFVEDRLLQRNVKAVPYGLSPQGQLIAAVNHPNGSIAKFLLQSGLARCTDYHSTLLGSEMAPLREAERAAQAAKQGLHKGHVAKERSAGSNVEAVVTKVFSADVIYVQSKAGAEKRINISSIRGPRQNESTEAPFRDEAKEYLRKRLIGKRVRVSIDGSRAAVVADNGESYDAKDVATITMGDKNIGLLLVEAGWASVVRHKRDDPDRAPNYDELLAAGEKAKEEKKGMWSGKPSSAKNYIDQSESVQKAKLGLGTLQRQKKIPAIVDFVKGGSRFVVLVPKESMKLNFVLGGVKVPKSARSATDKSEPYGKEAHDFAVRRLTQRDVQIDVSNIDKFGGFIGEIYIGGESFAKTLVEEGLASVHSYSAKQAGTANELSAAEDRAKAARKNMWTDYDPTQDEAANNEDYSNGHVNGGAAPAVRQQDLREVMVSDISREGKIKLQMLGSSSSALENLMKEFKSFHLNNSASLPGPPKVGDLVSARFSADGQWYRGRVRANDRTAKEAEILFIDYGNSEKQKWEKLRPLNEKYGTTKLSSQAKDAVLTLVEIPTKGEYLQDFVAYLGELTEGRALSANIDFTDKDGTLHVTLASKDASSLDQTINALLIKEGLALVTRKPQVWERSLIEETKLLRAAQQEAENEHLNMWEYGDITAED